MPLRPLTFWLLTILALAILAGPVWLVDIPPLVDYPAHLMRTTLLAALPLDPALAQYWSVAIRPVPNLALDLFVPAVASLIGVEAGLKLFITLALAVWLVGAALLFRGLWGRHDGQALLAAPFAVNAPFQFGFLNFHFGAGLALVGAGLWLGRPARSPFLLAGLAALAMALLFCHLMTVAILALLIGGIELGRLMAEGWSTRRAVVAACDMILVFLPSAVLYVLWIERGEGGAVVFRILANLAAPFAYSSGLGGVAHNPVPALLVAIAVTLAWTRGWLRARPEGLGVLIACAIATLLMPANALGGTGVHMRMAAILMVVVVCALSIDWAGLVPVRWPWTLVGYLGLLTLGSGLSLVVWQDKATGIAELRRMNAAALPIGAHVATASVARDQQPVEYLAHVADLAALDRRAFVPTVFTTPGQSTIRLSEAYRGRGASNAIDGGMLSLADIRLLLDGRYDDLDPSEQFRLRPYRAFACSFDHLLLLGATETADLPRQLTRVATARLGALYRVVPPADGGCPA